MQETNEGTTNPQPNPETCMLRIMFPVTSDEHALSIKREIGKLLSSIPEAVIQFSIQTKPKGIIPPMG